MPGKQSIRFKDFTLPVYSNRVIFIYSNSFNLIAEYAKSENFCEKDIKTLKDGGYRGYCIYCSDDTKEGKTNTYIIITKDKDKYKEIDTISHEIFHAVYSILSDRGIKLNKSNEETYAYLIGYLANEFFKFRDEKR